MVEVSSKAPYGINPKNGKPYTYWQAVFDESSKESKKAQDDFDKSLDAELKGASAGAGDILDRIKNPRGVFADPILIPAQGAYGLSEFLVGYKDQPTLYKNWYQQMEEEPLFHKLVGKDEKGNPKYKAKMETFPEFVTKLWAQRKKRQRDEAQAEIDEIADDYAGLAGLANAPKGAGVSLPGLGSMPELPQVDWQGIRDRINNLDVDTEYEAPRKDPLVMLGEALANIDLTSNLAGDWSKTAKIASDFQQYNNEQAKKAKNLSAEKKADLAMWKAMKDISLQEAQADAAMKNAEFGLRWKQLQMQSAMNQAKANAYYNGLGGTGFGLGFGRAGSTEAIKQQAAAQAGYEIALRTLQNHPDLSSDQMATRLVMSANSLGIKNPAFVNGWNQALKESEKAKKKKED